MNKKEKNEESKKNKEFFEAVKLLSKDTGVTVDAMCESIQNVLIGALKKEYNNKDIVFCDVDAEKGEFRVYLRKTVVSEISDPDTDLLVEQAQQYKKGAVAGDIVEIPVETAKVSRITAEKGKHMLRQAIREAEQGQLRSELESHNQEIITVTVQRVIPESGDAVVSLGKTEALLYKSEQLPDEVLKPNDIIKVFVAGVRSTDKNTRATISRTHPGLVRRLFEEEVPEIFDGTVEIKAVAREAGSRTKMAVYSADPDVDPVGACIGPRGARVGKIVDLLGGEIAEDLAAYFVESEQIPSACGLGVLVDTDHSVKAAGGFLVQLMPGAPEELITKLEDNIFMMDQLTTILDEDGADAIIPQVMRGLEPETVLRHPMAYRCACSRARVEQALRQCGVQELQDMIADGKNTQVHCQFCDAEYVFTPAELQTLLDAENADAAAD